MASPLGKNGQFLLFLHTFWRKFSLDFTRLDFKLNVLS